MIRPTNQIEAEKSAFEKAAEFSVTDLRYLQLLSGSLRRLRPSSIWLRRPGCVWPAGHCSSLPPHGDGHERGGAAAGGARASDLGLWQTHGDRDWFRQAPGEAASSRKKEALVEAAHHPDTASPMGRLMAQRAAALRKH